ncbi:MAG: amidohydrolase [Alphaproteobacteria bacterium]|nr:MAG: amidohydrolase [Alphaproteobacteria bacterium]
MAANRLRIIDAHHHLWDLGHCHYPWLIAKGARRFFGDPAPIQRNYLAADFASDSAGFDLLGSVHIEVGVAPSDQIKETRWVQAVADSHPPIAAAIVAAADLRHSAIEDVLAEHARSPHFRGVRQIVGRHPDEDAATGSDALIDDPRWRMGLRVLCDLRFSFDLQMIPAQYERLFRALAGVPDLKVAICHFGSPWDRSAAGFAHWRKWMARFASLPRVHLKFSGFGMFQPDWTLDEIRPFVHEALDLFSPARCMTGSNFPVDKLYGEYGRIWHAVDALSRDLTADERAALLHETARTFYRIA